MTEPVANRIYARVAEIHDHMGRHRLTVSRSEDGQKWAVRNADIVFGVFDSVQDCAGCLLDVFVAILSEEYSED